ncbi:MATE family efflux transporter [Chloroflexota bacterium]
MNKNDIISPERNTKSGRDLTKGSILRNVLSLGWPIIIGSSINSLGPTIDMIWVGKLGVAAVAGVGVASMLVMLLDNFKMGLDMGSRAMVARFFGAGDILGANNVALQGYFVTIAFAAIVGTIGFILAGPILKMMGLPPEVVTQGTPYLRIQFIGILTLGLVRQNEGIMQSSGDTVNPMRVVFFYRLFHVVLCPFLVFGWWIFPRLGTVGAAYSNLISACLGAILGLWILISGRTQITLSFRNFTPDPKLMLRIVKIGAPASITGIERNFGQVLLTWFVIPFGTMAVAAHSLIQRIDQFLFMPGAGLGNAAGVIAAQNLGAGQPERAEKSGWVSVGLFTVIMSFASLAVWFWGKTIVGIFNNEPQLVELTHTFLKIAIVSYMVFGMAQVLQQCLTSAGDTVPTMLIVLLSIWGVQVPLAYLLSQFTSLGVYGTRWGIVSATVVRAISYSIYFRLGRWKRKKV